nr:thioesterase family protein [Frisingicoccus sp.]
MKEIIIEDTDDKTLYESCYERRAQYYETDQMGIIHHSNYIRWFEEARLHFMDEIGLSYAKIEEMGILIPVLSVDCQYKTMVHYNDIVDIYTQIIKFNGVKMTIAYRVVDHVTGEIRCTGETSHAFLNREYRPVRLKREYPDLYELFISHLAVE